MKRNTKGFTLIELLIVIVIIAILMGLVFRLMGVAKAGAAKNTTMVRMQKLENAISAYNAEFGSYPPVAIHGSRDIYVGVGDDGEQSKDESRISNLQWANINAACRSQPIDVKYPTSKEGDTALRKKILSIKKYWSKNKNGNATKDIGTWPDRNSRVSDEIRGKREWSEIKMFRFGLLSYLLPRYLFMISGNGQLCNDFAQWTDSNALPDSYDGWDSISDMVDGETDEDDYIKIADLPSQRVCARWMPNLEGIVNNGGTFYGVNTSSPWPESGDLFSKDTLPNNIYLIPGSKNEYVALNSKTVLDGWGREFYYSSEPPFQSYRLWSAGPDGGTFPPWMPLDQFATKKFAVGNTTKTVSGWIEDDVTFMSN